MNANEPKEPLSPEALVDLAMQSLPPSFRVIVSCDGEGTHKTRQVASFRLASNGGWVSEEPRYERSHPDEGIRHLSKRAAETQVLDTNDHLVPASQHDNDVTRLKYVIDCKLCTLNVSVRAERLYQALDRLRAADKSSLALRSLGAIVGV